MRPPLVAVVVLCAALLVPADAAVAAPARACRELGTKRWKLRAISAEGTTCTAARREAQAYAALETDSAELGRPGTYNVNDYGCRAWRVSRSPRALRVRCVADPMPGATDPPQGTVRFTMYRRSGVS